METLLKVFIAFVVTIFVLVLLPRFLINRQFSQKSIMQETRELYSGAKNKTLKKVGIKTGVERVRSKEMKKFRKEELKDERRWKMEEQEAKRRIRREEAFARGDKFIL